MPKGKGFNGPFFLSLIGTLLYLYVLYNVRAAMPAWLGAQTASQGMGGAVVPTYPSVIMAVMFGLAMASALSLLLTILVGAMAVNKDMRKWQLKAGFISGLSLFALTAAPAPGMLFWLTAAGFVLAQIGSGMSSM